MSGIDPTTTFRQEAQELLEVLEQALLDLEHAPGDTDLIDSAFRALHTIKGSGAMFGFDAVAAFTHHVETAFDLVRKGKVTASRELIAVALTAKDRMRVLIERPETADAEAGDAILAALKHIVDGSAALPTVQPGLTTWRIDFRLPQNAMAMGTNPLLLLDELRGLGTATVTALTDAIPPLSELVPTNCHIGWSVVLSTRAAAFGDRGRVRLRDRRHGSADHRYRHNRRARPGLAKSWSIAVTPSPKPSRARCPVSLPLGDAAGQRWRTEPGQAQLGARGAAACAGRDAGGSKGRRQHPGAGRTSRRTDGSGRRTDDRAIPPDPGRGQQQRRGRSSRSPKKSSAWRVELRDTTMGVRTLPIGSLFGRFRRLVHDLAQELGKKIELTTIGEETELDKTMIERLNDPLIHLIRNAIDHGLEVPEAREAAGKPAPGQYHPVGPPCRRRGAGFDRR